MAGVCLQVCVLCGEAAGGEPSAGRRLYEVLFAATAEASEIAIAPVNCLAVCDRPVTLAFQAPGKWSYLVGGADAERDVADIAAAARAVAAAPQGIPAMDDRPPFFRNGVVARVPPISLWLSPSGLTRGSRASDGVLALDARVKPEQDD